MNGFSCLLRMARAADSGCASHDLGRGIATITVLGGLWLAALTSHPAVAKGQVLQTIALQGEPAPNAPGASFGSYHTTYSSPLHRILLNNSGEVALQSSLARGSEFGHFGVWAGPIGDLKLIVHSRMEVPGGGQYERFWEAHQLTFGDGGQIAFYGDTSVSTNRYDGVWSTKSGSLGLVALQRSIPLLLDGLAIDNTGSVAFSAGPPGYGIWSDRSGILELEFQRGQAAPGVVGALYDLLRVQGLNEILAFTANTLPGPGLWRNTGDETELVIHWNSSVPDVPSAKFASLHFSPPNSRGEVAFAALLKVDESAGVTAENQLGLWLESENGFRLVVREGDAAPGTLGDEFDAMYRVQYNEARVAVFTAGLRGSDGIIDTGRDRSIWIFDSGKLQLIAREGDQVPDGPRGVVFQELQSFSSFSLNRAGQVAFQAALADGVVEDGSILDSLWATDRSGALRLIARRGSLLDVDSGPGRDLREVSQVTMGGILPYDLIGGTEAGWSTAFNDRGQIAFVATFTDGTWGAFVSNLVAVPEREAAGLAIVAIAALGGSRRYAPGGR